MYFDGDQAIGFGGDRGGALPLHYVHRILLLVAIRLDGWGNREDTLLLDVVLISAISTGGSGAEDRLTENVTPNFSKVSLDYVPQDDKGAPGIAIPMTWDIATNTNN